MITITIARKHVYMLVALVAVVAMLLPAGVRAANQFSDVPDSNFYHNDIAWLKDNLITNGCGDGSTYCPTENVTREQMAAFLRRIAEKQAVDAKEVNGGTAYMLSLQTAPTLDEIQPALADWSYNSNGPAITWKRWAVGRYQVTIPGWSGMGNVQVTTRGFPGVNCQETGFTSALVFVACYTSAGSLTNAQFSVLVTGG